MLKKHKLEIFLVGGILILAIIAIILINVLKKPGKYVVVVYDGKEVAKYSLNETASYNLSFTDGEFNRLIIENGKARISNANCRDELCVKQFRPISRTGESIICRPHKLVIKIVGEGKEIVDVVT